MQKRYQYMSQEGPKWTSWFRVFGDTTNLPKYQIGTANTKFKLLNEYREDE